MLPAHGVRVGCKVRLGSSLTSLCKSNARRSLSVALSHVGLRSAASLAPADLQALVDGGAAWNSGSLPPLLSRYKAASFDEDACRVACLKLAESVATGNGQHFEGLVTALRLMMPAASGAEKAQGLPRDDFILRPEVLTWSQHDFLGGLDENARIVQQCEAEFARRMASHPEGFRAPEILAAGLDLAVVYLKNYALDKADSLYMAMESHCMSRGLPWDVKFMQDLATLRCKQNRQADAAVLLEGVAQRTPPHEATLRNLGTVYNMLREHDKASEYFKAASELVGELGKEDLWNLGIVHMHKKEYDDAADFLERAMMGFLQDQPDDHVTIAKLRDSLGMCYDGMGRYEDALYQLEDAQRLYRESIGTESPLYGTACERLARARVNAGLFRDGLEAMIEAFTVHAMQDSVHPTPLFELLGLALEDIPPEHSDFFCQLARLEAPITAAVRNMHHRGLNDDANAAVLFERMARALLLSSSGAHIRSHPAAGTEADASRRRTMARTLLVHADPLVKAATRDGLADLTHVSRLIDAEMKALDAQEAAMRGSIVGTTSSSKKLR